MNSVPDKLDRSGVFRQMCYIRHFEQQVARASEQNLIPAVVYLAVGQEAVAATVAPLTEGFSVFNQHRCHAIYLAHGGSPERLRDELLGREDGCCAGRGGSPSAQDPAIPMFAYHGLIGEHIPLATGYALATARPTLVYFGDAASEEDYALTSFGFAATHRLPVLFVCEDNDLSILTPVRDRRNWQVTGVVRSMGLACAEVEDDPEQIFAAVRGLRQHLPAFINVKTCRHLWHAGTGIDAEPAQDRLALFRHQVAGADRIEAEAARAAQQLWQGCLSELDRESLCETV
jgi:pyruvate dehydrogenase E1 component alpha subunit